MRAGLRPRRGAAGLRAARRRRPLPGDGQGLCARALRLRPADRQLPGDQAQAGRHVRQERARALQRLLRRLGAEHRRRRTAARRRARRGSPPPRPSGSRRRRTSRPTAASASPGRSDCHLYYRRSRQLALVAGAPRSGRNGWSATSNGATRPERSEHMDFNDTPEEAAYRAKARAWLEANAPKHARRCRRRPTTWPGAKAWQAQEGRRRLRLHHLAQGMGRRRRHADPAGDLRPGRGASIAVAGELFHDRPRHVRADGDGLRRRRDQAPLRRPRACAARRSGASCSPSPPAAPTWRRSAPRAVPRRSTTG